MIHQTRAAAATIGGHFHTQKLELQIGFPFASASDKKTPNQGLANNNHVAFYVLPEKCQGLVRRDVWTTVTSVRGKTGRLLIWEREYVPFGSFVKKRGVFQVLFFFHARYGERPVPALPAAFVDLNHPERDVFVHGRWFYRPQFLRELDFRFFDRGFFGDLFLFGSQRNRRLLILSLRLLLCIFTGQISGRLVSQRRSNERFPLFDFPRPVPHETSRNRELEVGIQILAEILFGVFVFSHRIWTEVVSNSGILIAS